MNVAQEQGPGADAAFEGYLAAVRARRNALVMTSLGVMTAFLVFAWSSYRTLGENFAHDKLVANGERVGTTLALQAQPQLIEAAKELVPVYRSEAERALDEIVPKLRDRSMAELKLLQQHLTDKSRAAIERATVAPIQSNLRELAEHFPALNDEQYVAQLLAKTEMALEKELQGVLDDTHAVYRPQLERLTKAMDSLRSERLAAMTNDELMQRFMHLWILLIDTELMGVAPCSIEELSMVAPSGRPSGG